jgi:hypothetical protein
LTACSKALPGSVEMESYQRLRAFIEACDPAGEQTTIGEALDRAQARVRELEEARRQINAHSSRVEAELAEAREQLEYRDRRERHFARVLGVPDGGQYVNDWDSRLEGVLRELAECERTNNSVRVCANHTREIVDGEGCVVCELAEAREALRLGIEAMERHGRWCGYKADAPGDVVWQRFLDAARAALSVSGAAREPDETAGLQRSTREARPNQPGSPSGSPSVLSPHVADRDPDAPSPHA